MTLQSLILDPGSAGAKPSLRILNQLLLPHETVYVPIRNSRTAFAAIKQMLVRGAPAIALVAALALAVEDPFNASEPPAQGENATIAAELEASAPITPDGTLQPLVGPQEIARWYQARLRYLVESRPTAVNLADAARKLSATLQRATEEGKDASGVQESYIQAAKQMLADDVRDNKNIGRAGRDWIVRASQLTPQVQGAVVTICNTG